MDFDNLPNFQPNSKRATDITQAPPVPNPYHHLTFSDGYVYAPQPSEPYLPSSEPHLAVFLANGTGVTARSVQPGEIGDGPYESNSAFWFDAFSAMMGCDNAGPDPCTIIFTGYTYSAAAKDEIATYTQNATIAPCPAMDNCPLQPVSFPTSFRSLSGVRMQAFVGNEERMFFLDDMALGWSNNTCQAGMTRQRYHLEQRGYPAMPDQTFYDGLFTKTIRQIHENRGLADGPGKHLVVALPFATLRMIHRDPGLHDAVTTHESLMGQLVVYDDAHLPVPTSEIGPAPVQGRCLILALPLELRNRIYEMVIDETDWTRNGTRYNGPRVDQDSVTDSMPLLIVSKQVWHEATEIWYDVCDFNLHFLGLRKRDGSFGLGKCTKWLNGIGDRNIKHVRRVSILLRVFVKTGSSQSREYEFGINLKAQRDEDLVDGRDQMMGLTMFDTILRTFESDPRELACNVRLWEARS
ncbi:hypothetical protein LTR17_009365 [Elasticomyces elasticus]|nr:hypothetical protein LTR17_009365 [Elasticomyces elasticus]